MLRKENTDIENILIDKLSGETLAPEDEKLLDEWLKKGKNSRRFQQLQHIRNAVYANKAGEQADSEKAWMAFMQGRRPQRRLSRILAYAAVAAVLVGFGLWFALMQRPDTGEVVAVAQSSTGNVKNAVLTLSNGQQVVLSDTPNDLQEQDGTVIRTKEKELVYNPAGTEKETVYNTVNIPRGAEYKLVLADGTTVWLNAGSELVFPVSFTGTTREVRLKGEAFFDVAKDTQHPFIVHAANFDVRVTGTQFNVRNYAESPASTTLAEGSVEVIQGQKKAPLAPGQQAVLTGQEIQVRQVDLEEAIAWRYNAFCFKQQPLEELLEEIARWYDVEVFYTNTQLKSLHFTAWFHRSTPLAEVADILERTQKIKLEINGKTLIIKPF